MGLLKQLIDRLTGAEDRRHVEGFVVYTRPDCDCTAEAVAAIKQHGCEPLLLMLEDHPEVRSEFGGATPLVKIDGRVRFYGKIQPILFKRLIHARSKRRR